MDTGRRRVDAPQDDQPGLRIILVDDGRHLAVQGEAGGAGGCGADCRRQTRGAEAAPQLGVVRHVREQPVRAAVVIGEDGFGAVGFLDLGHPARDQIERLVPRDPDVGPVSLRSLPDRRVEDTVLAVDTLVEAADLGADEIAGDGIVVAAVDFPDAAALDGDVERAGVWTIERAGGADGGMSPGLGRRGLP